MTDQDDATRDGASTTGTDEGAQRTKSPREIMLEQIGERLDQARAGQIHTETQGAAATDDEGVLVDDPKRFKVRVAIGDREEERSLDAVLQELQTSQGRLRSLSQRERELQAALVEKDQQLEAQLAVKAAGSDGGDDQDNLDASVSEAANALAEGDIEKASAALRAAIEKGRQAATPQIDETSLVEKVRDGLTREQEKLQRDQVWDAFVQDHPEFRVELDPISQQPIVTEERQYGDFIYNREYAQRVAAGEIGYQQALTETAEKVSKAFSRSTAGDGGGKKPVSEFDRRKELKQEIDTLPVAAGAKVASQGAATTESHAETIREMRKARGLPA